LLFGSRLVEQYELARHDLGMSDAAIADLARGSVRGSMAPGPLRERLLTGIDAWLAADPAEPGDPADAADGGRDPARA
jgi:adenosine deaminase